MRGVSCDFFRQTHRRIFIVLISLNCLLFAQAIPFFEETEIEPETITEAPEASTEAVNATNTSAQDLYIIKTIVYEVGILVDAENSTNNLTETHQQVDLTFYDPANNGSVIDLSNIPVPIQTNVSNHIVTGFAPANFGTIAIPENSSGNHSFVFPVFPDAVLSITNNISTTNGSTASEILSNLPPILGLNSPIFAPAPNDTVEKTDDETTI